MSLSVDPVPSGAEGVERPARLVCRRCRRGFLLRFRRLRAFLYEDGQVTVRPGFTEVCPFCRHRHVAGDVLQMAAG